MTGKNFTEDDKKKLIELLNFVAKNAEFNGLNVQSVLDFTKLLSHAQQVILPKINDHILEIKRVIEAPKEAEPQAAEISKPSKAKKK
jgi:hypothetical protein